MRLCSSGALALLCGLWLSPNLTHAEGGPICAALSRETVSVPDDDPRLDVYKGTGDSWLSADLRQRYPPPPAAPQSAKVLRFQLQRVRQTFEGAAFASPSGKLLQGRLLAELALLDAALATLDPDKPVSLAALKGLYGLARLDQSSDFSESCNGTRYTTNSLYFEDAARSEQLVLRATGEGTAGVPGLSLPVAAEPRSFVSIDEASEFRAALAAVRGLLNEPLLRSVERTASRLVQINRSWSNYLEHGFSQYPWEAWINSLGPLRWDDAPWSQWIFLHPELALVVDARRLRGSEVAPALLVHGLGFAFYGETRSWFLGLSATGAVTTQASWGLGAGGSLHFGHTRLFSVLPHLSLSVLIFATERGKLGPFVGVSADFWRLVSDSSESLFKGKLLQ